MKLALAPIVFSFAALTLSAQNFKCPPPISHISIEDGSLSPMPDVTFRLHHFAATLIPLGKKAPACYSKMTVVAHAEIFVSNESLTRVFAEKLGGPESKIKDFKVENGLGKVSLSGHITKVIPVQFSIEGPVTTDGALLLVNAHTIKADGIPVKALLNLIGEHLGSVLGMKGMKGISVDGDTLTFSPEEIAHLKGYLVGVETTPQGLTLRYGKKPLHPVLASNADPR